MKNLKRNILLSLVLLLATSTYATNMYWVGGTGNWNDAKHWSLTTGGSSGNVIPTSNDDVYFDQNSFSADKQTVKIITNAVCRNIDWSSIDDKAIFSAASSRTLQVYGSYILSPLLNNGFKGQTIFSSQQNGNTLKTAECKIIGDWIFDGTGSWSLTDNVTTEENVSIKLLQGSLSTNDKAINCGYFSGNSSKTRALNLGSSRIIVNKLWDCSSPANLTLTPGTSSILLKDIVDNSTFRSGGLLYNDVGILVTFCVPSGTPCVANIIITMASVDVTCNGVCDGAAMVISVSGGCGGPYTFDWQGPVTPCGDFTDSICNLCAGNYTVRVTDGCGSFCFCNINVAEPSVLFDYELFNIPASCNGVCDAVIGVDATGGTFPYTFLWTLGGGPGNTDSTLCAGSYDVIVTDSNGCTGSTTVVATEPPLLLSPGSSTDVTCFGFCDGTASVVASGGSPPYTYSWTGSPIGDSTANITNLCPGVYTVTVTDANFCTSTFSATITEPPVLTLTMSQTNASCGGVCDGTATATITGGTPPYNYVWSTGASTLTGALTNTISGLCAGTYTVDVTDANGCIITDSVIITEPPILVVTATGTDVLCFGACNGTATAGVVGGTPGYSYFWTPGVLTGQGTPTITNLCPGSYTVTVTDLNGCTATDVVVITEPTLLVANFTSTNLLCFVPCNGTATALPTGGTPGYTYDWLSGAPSGDGTDSIFNLCPGTYSVIVTDTNGCIDTSAAIVITQPPILSAGATSTNVTCFGLCNGTATSTPTGGTPGYTYLWSTTATTPGISGLCPGSYTVIVTDANGCTISQTVVITQPNLLTVSIVSTTLSCNGDCVATATATINGGTPIYTIDWTPGAPIGDSTLTISSLCAGTYTVAITDLNGCPATASTTILQPTALTLATFVTDVSCFGLCDGAAATIAGGGTPGPGYSYLWSPGGQTTSSISGQCAGTYTVCVTDFNGCSICDTVTITQPNQLFANPFVVSNITCAGAPCNGSASSTATGGTGGTYTYSWMPGGANTPSISALCAGVYNLTVTDSNSCTSTMPITIIQPLVLTAPITGSTSSCNICNGTATVTPSGGTPGYTYSWNNGQTTQTAVGLCPNVTYTVIVTDTNGCVATNTVTILQTITITITTSNTTLSCFGACDGVVTANASGGTPSYSFIWTGPVCGGPVGIISLTPTATGLGAGTYTVNVTDAAGCFNVDSITFTNPPLLTVSTVSTNATCAGVCDGTATATGAGGTGTITYSWNSVPVQNTATATGLCAGSYTLTATDSSGCTALDTVVITEPLVVTDNVTITDANCTFADGSITVAPTGGLGAGSYTYDWNGVGTPTGDGTTTITGLVPGVYTLAITSGACTYNFSYLLSNILGPITTMSHTDVTCFGDCDGTVSVVATGGTPGYTYNWTPGTPTGNGTPTITALCGTITYTVQVTDTAGCITFDLDTVTNPALISPNPVVVNESCGGTCDGSISLFPTGGTGGYTFAWTSGATTSSITGLCAGAYTFTVTDANGCDSTLTITILSPPPLVVTLSSTNVLCNSACNGTATAGVVGGTGPGTYTYSWLPFPPLGPIYVLPNVVGLCPGTYDVTVTDTNGCVASDTVIITEPTALTTTTDQDDVTCFGLCDGIAIVIPSGGTAPYSFLWNDPLPQTNDSAIGLCPGSYTPIVTDANLCVSTPPPVVITQPAPIVPNAVGVNPLCNNSCNGTATATPTGGSLTYTYLWSDGLAQNTATAVGLCAGTYTVTVDDGFCSSTQSVTLTDPAVLNANASATSPTCVGDCDGSVTSTPLGGTGPVYNYSWTPGPFVTQTVINLCPNVYTVIVTDQNGCADTQAVTLANPLGIDVVIGSTPAACGVCDGTISLTPITGLGPYTYVWTDSSGGSPPSPFAGNGTANVTGVCAGLYDVLVTDSNGCDSLFTIPMNNSSGPTSVITSTTNASCFGVCDGSASIDTVNGGTAPYSFLWNDPAATTNDTAFNLCDSTYFIIITDTAGCVFIPSVIINEPTPIVPNEVITLALCSNICTGAITVAPSGGTGPYTYDWGPDPIVGDGTPTVTGLCAGTYTLTITDSNLCVTVDSFVVGQSTPLLATIGVSNISCSSACSGMAYVTISSGTGPYAIQWNDGAGQTNDTATALCVGNYIVNITDSLGCILSLDTTITATPAVSANAVITDATCNLCDGSAVLAPTGGTGAYTYVWSNGDNTATGDSLCAGLYTVDITDAVGCVTSVSIPVSNPSGPTSATIVSTNIVCNGVCSGSVASITPVGGTAPYTFLWIASGLTTPTLSSLCAGTYFVQITDANGCSLMDSVIITEPSPILANQVIVATTCGLCDGSIALVPTGGAGGYTYLWTAPSSTNDTLLGLCPGVYTVDITDVAGCIQNVMIALSSQFGPTVTTFPTDVTCNGSCNGIDSAYVTGLSPFSYLWNDVGLQTTPVATALCAGTYFVTVTDNAGCITIASSTISEPDSIGFSVANTLDPLCNGNANGTITVIPSGGTLSYTYSWNTVPPQTTATATGLDANTYIVTVTDANGCTATQTATLTNPTSLTISNTFIPSSCNTIADGSINVTVGGGTLPYIYQWSGGSTATTEDLTGILSGTYTIMVTDSNSCTIADTIVLLPAQTVIADAGNDTSFCTAGSITLDASASVNGITYQWFDMADTLLGSSVTLTFNPPVGTNSFYVVVDNGTGCTDSDTIDVTANPLPNASAGADITIVIGVTTPIGGSPTTSTGGATISWLPITGLDNASASNPNANPTTTTTYTVTVTTAQGCTAVDSVVVTVRPTIIFPDGISPNADGANDEWIIDGIELFPNCEVEVYNRWGELLFQSVGYKETWKGTFKGQLLPVGTYYYVIDLKDELFPDAYTGPITIMR